MAQLMDEGCLTVPVKVYKCSRPNCENLSTDEPSFSLAGIQIGPYCEEHWKIFSQGFNKVIEDCFLSWQDKWMQFFKAVEELRDGTVSATAKEEGSE